MTIRQLLNATQAHSDAEWTIDDAEVGQVRRVFELDPFLCLMLPDRSQLSVKLFLSTAKQQIACIGWTMGQGGWRRGTGSTQALTKIQNDGVE